MKIEFVTNASFRITFSHGRTLLTDPMYYGGIYYGGWYNFPPLREKDRERYLQPVDYLYISHVHPDHLEPRTLKRISRDTPVLIGKLPHDHLLRKIRSLGFSDIRELPLGERVNVDGFQAAILGPFAPTSENVVDDVGYAMDTSIVLYDPKGSILFNNVDNTIQEHDARFVSDKYGKPDVAILPYGGASMYPSAFAQYEPEKKDTLKAELRDRMLKRFIGLSRAIGARTIVPAAGSYVWGSSVAHYSRYLHQATPAQIDSAWRKGGISGQSLQIMYAADVMDVSTGELQRNAAAPMQDFTEEDRLAYAMSLGDAPLDHERIVIPSQFEMPWPRLLKKARSSMRAQQERLGIRLDHTIVLIIDHLRAISSDGPAQAFWQFSLAEDGIAPLENLHDVAAPYTMFRVDSRLMLMLLLGAAIWNNAELGGCIELYRRDPDLFMPTVHSLMSFFML